MILSHQYTDKDEVKTWLGITGTGQDTNLDFAIDAAFINFHNHGHRRCCHWLNERCILQSRYFSLHSF